jgi:hypothetical protein
MILFSWATWIICIGILLLYAYFFEEEVTVGDAILGIVLAPLLVVCLIIEFLGDSDKILWRKK